MLWTKELNSVQFFKLLGALMKVHPVPHAVFEITRSGCIHNFEVIDIGLVFLLLTLNILHTCFYC